MDNVEFTSSADKGQLEIAARDFRDALDRGREDLTFEIGRVIRNAINDATGDDPSACACAFYIAEQALKRVIQEQDWVTQQARRAFQQALP